MIATTGKTRVSQNLDSQPDGAARTSGVPPTDAVTLDSSVSERSVHELHELLVEQQRILAAQTSALEALERRRQEVDELIEVAMPIANAAGLALIGRLDALDKSGAPAWIRSTATKLGETASERPPSLLQLWRRARSPHARRGLGIALEALCALATMNGGRDVDDNDRGA